MLRVMAASAFAAVLLAGCTGGYREDRYGNTYYDGCRGDAAVGTVVGGAAGGVIGNQFGSGSGRTAATIGGVILGAIAGNAIARDACRDERADAYYYNRSYYDAFDRPRYGERYEWHNPHTGHYGYVTPRRAYADGRRWGYRGECREFTQEIYIDDYRSEEVTGVACRQDDGSWRVVSR